jgi:hypothetical protein
MSSTAERLQVLKMIDEGKISADEGAELLRVLSTDEPARPSEPLKGASTPRWFRVRITETKSGKNIVSLDIPFGVVRTGLRMGARFVPELNDSEYGDLVEVLKSGQQGKVIDVTDEESGERVEVFIE